MVGMMTWASYGVGVMFLGLDWPLTTFFPHRICTFKVPCGCPTGKWRRALGAQHSGLDSRQQNRVQEGSCSWWVGLGDALVSAMGSQHAGYHCAPAFWCWGQWPHTISTFPLPSGHAVWSCYPYHDPQDLDDPPPWPLCQFRAVHWWLEICTYP